MAVLEKLEGPGRARRTSLRVGWCLLSGGAFFFVGGGMHPKEDPPDVTVKEHLQVMFEDPAWFPSHAVLLVGMVLISVALVDMARRLGSVSRAPARQAVLLAAVASVLATVDMGLHLLVAFESDRIVAGQATPLVDVHVVMETITVPLFGSSIAVLALIGAWTHTLGNWFVAVLGVVGGLGYGLAAATFLFTDRLDFLFPVASGIGLWAVAAGFGLIRARV